MSTSFQPRPHILTAAESSIDRKTLDQVLWWIHEMLSAESGEGFFQSLIYHLSNLYEIRHAFITRCMDEPVTRVRTLANWSEGKLVGNMEFQLSGLPCDEMISTRKRMWIPSALGTVYPGKKGWAEGYCGAPLFSTNGQCVIGHIAFFSPGSMARNMFDDPLFHMFVARGNAELRRLAAEEEAHQHQLRLSHAGRLAELGEMSSLIAHELAQPLSTIAMRARLEMRTQEARTKAMRAQNEEALEVILQEAERAQALLVKIRNFSRHSIENAALCDLNQISIAAIALVQFELASHSVQLHHVFDTDIPLVQAVRIEIEQVLVNLLRNAIEAVTENTIVEKLITLKTAVMEQGTTRMVRTTVQDNGIGMEAESIHRLGEPFFTTKKNGLGLGLALCKTIVKKHGGHFQIRPDAQGAIIDFDLPAVTAD